MFLIHVFLYCYFCSRFFDNEIEINLKCADYHVRDIKVQRRIFDRKQKIILMNTDLSYLKDKSLETELDKHVIKVADNVYKCYLCHKTFEQSVYVKKHIKNKHKELCSDEEQNIYNFNLFVDKIDINLRNYFNGIDNNYLPSFCVYEEEGYAVKYDLERAFSGHIKI